MTSHSRKGQTADLVLIHDDTELEAKTRSCTEWPASPSHAAHTPPAYPARIPRPAAAQESERPVL